MRVVGGMLALLLLGCTDDAVVAVEQGIVCDSPVDLRLSSGGGSGLETLVDIERGLSVFFADNRDLRSIEVSKALNVLDDTLPPLGLATFIEDLSGHETPDGLRVYFTRRGDARHVVTGVLARNEALTETRLFPNAANTEGSISARAPSGHAAIAWREDDVAHVAALIDPVTVGATASAPTTPSREPMSLLSHNGSFWLLYGLRSRGVTWGALTNDGLSLRGELPTASLARMVEHNDALYVVAVEDAALVIHRLATDGEIAIEVTRINTSERATLLRVGSGDRAPLTIAWTEGFVPYVVFMQEEQLSPIEALPHEGEAVDIDVRSLIGGGIVAIEERDPDVSWLRRRCGSRGSNR